MSLGSAEKTVPDGVVAERIRRRVLEVRDRDVGALEEVAHRARRRRSASPAAPPSRRPEQHVWPVMSARAAVEREVDALLLDLDGLRDAAVEQDVAARDERPERRRVERRPCRAGRVTGAARSAANRRSASRGPRRRATRHPRPGRGRSDRPVRRAGTRGACGSWRGPSRGSAASAARTRCGRRRPAARRRARRGSRRRRRRRARARRRPCSSRPGPPRPPARGPLRRSCGTGSPARSGRRRAGGGVAVGGTVGGAAEGGAEVSDGPAGEGLGCCGDSAAARRRRSARRPGGEPDGDRDGDGKQRQNGDEGKALHGRE